MDRPWRPHRAALVVNTRSRAGAAAFDAVHRQLLERDVPLVGAFPVRDPSRIPETVSMLLDGGCDLLVLGAGDGTVSSVVDFLAHRPVVLGLLPLGTANDFARTLQIPTDVRLACETVAAGRVVDVDLGMAGGNYFVNVASVGLSVGVTRHLSDRLKRHTGKLAYAIAAAKSVLRHRPFTARLSFPDGDHEPIVMDRLLQVAVGNGRFYGGGAVVAPDAGIDDQTLDVYAIPLRRRRDLFGVARQFRSGAFVNRPDVTHLTTTRVLLATEPVEPLNIDGEVVAHTPQEFSVARNCLKVIVPAESTAARLDDQAWPGV